jgi:tRNA threonylcarbamoyladenosine biosynthesis protein TsaE
MTWEVKDESELVRVAREITEKATLKKFAFSGDLGAGKTTLIKYLVAELGYSGTVSSPTYGLVNEYTTAEGQPIFHFDFYRLNDPEEAYDFGIEEYFDRNAWCFMEWPNKIGSILPEEVHQIRIDVVHSTRHIQMDN